MEANNKEFSKASNTLQGLAQYYNIIENEPKGVVPNHTLENLKLMVDMRHLEENIQHLKLKSSEIKLTKDAAELNVCKGLVLEVVLRLKQDLEFLVKQKDSIPEAQAAARRVEGETLSCSNPKLVVQLVRCLSGVILNLGIPTKTLPNAAEWGEILDTMEQETSSPSMDSLKKCLDLMSSVMPLCYPE